MNSDGEDFTLPLSYILASEDACDALSDLLEGGGLSEATVKNAWKVFRKLSSEGDKLSCEAAAVLGLDGIRVHPDDLVRCPNGTGKIPADCTCESCVNRDEDYEDEDDERMRRSAGRSCRAVNAFRSPFGSQVVQRTSELKRIAALPRRVWTDEAAARLADMLTRELKTPRGTMKLRPVQAISLYEAMQGWGLFGPQPVGAGKTLWTLLVSSVLELRNPVLLLPAALIEKTWHERKQLAEHWRLPTNLQLISYESLGLVQSAQKLEYIQPELIVADELHYLKNRRAGRTRRVMRYMQTHPTTRFVGASGTVMKGSVKDFAHLLRWALKGSEPIPATDDEVEAWADALDEKVNPLGRRSPEVLFELSPGVTDDDKITRARRSFQSRLLETRGVVASFRTDDDATCSLRIAALEYKPAPITEQHIDGMRRGIKDARGEFVVLPWTTPDGWAFSQAVEFRMYLRQLALGFHAIWSPRPPPEWVAARRDWAAFVRETLSASHTLDTELQVTNAVDSGQLRTDTLAAWRAVRDTFKIQPKDVWHDDTALKVCERWMKDNPGIVWVEHVFFGRKLAVMTGITYYGAQGLSDRGESIVHVKPGRAIIASIHANRTGRNLQMFSQNLVTSCPPSADIVEQLIGRTHRSGQEADEVTVDILLGCREHSDAFDRALAGAKATADTLGHDQKLLLADVIMPDISSRRGPLWQ